MRYLVGSTGFVGSNLVASGAFDGCFHSTNISQAFGSSPDLLVYAGLRAEKYLANHDPARDFAMIRQAFDNICRIEPKRLVLISSVDVYRCPLDTDEDAAIETEGLPPYGYNRYRLEQMVRERFPDALVVRLPGLYGPGLKKNFVFDLIYRIPTMLNTAKYEDLRVKSRLVESSYATAESGFYRVRQLDAGQQRELRKFFEDYGFSAVNFTDSRSVFQMYPLRLLWCHIAAALESGLETLNLATEPVSAQEIYRAAEGTSFENLLPSAPTDYRMRSRHAALFGGGDGYLLDRKFVLFDLTAFIRTQKAALAKEDCP